MLALTGLLVGTGVGSWLRLRRYGPQPSRAPLSWWWVVLAGGLTGLAGLGMEMFVSPRLWPVAGIFLIGGLIASWTDFDQHMIFDWLSWPLAALLTAAIGISAAAQGQWSLLGLAVSCGLAAGLFMLALAVFGSMGGGDVKLSLSAGLILGYAGGWLLLYAGIVSAFILGALWAVVLLRKGRDRKTPIPLGPALVVGAVGCLLVSGALS